MRNVSRKLLHSILVMSMATGFVACSDDKDDDTGAPTKTGAGDQAAQSLTLTQAVVADARFSTLRTALNAAGLLSVLDSGEFTVFAPTNEAFAKIPSDQLQALLADKEALTKVLLYHVVAGSVPASEVLAKPSLDSANVGLSLKVSTRDQGAFINDSRILQTDIKTKNGIIHVIDTVLLPPAGDAATPDPTANLVDIVVNNADFSTLKTALVEASLVDTLKAGTFTVFAPTNAAFAKLPSETLTALLANPTQLARVLLYHVVPGNLAAQDVLSSSTLTTANSLSLSVNLRDGKPFINDSGIIATDVLASNGVVHVIDTVLLPPAEQPAPAPNLVELVVNSPQFSTLRAALEAAQLVDTIKNGNFTIFAPTNEAFAKIPQETLEALLGNKDALTQILLYHAVPGKLLAQDVLSSSTLTTANQLALSVSLRDGKPFINDSGIVATDVLASNGVVHVIDTVLLPPTSAPQQDPGLVDLVLNDSRFTTLKAALVQAELVEILASGEFTVFAPTNEAFAKIPPATLQALLADKTALTQILLYHVVPGKLDAKRVLAHPSLQTANKARLTVRKSGGKAFIGGSQIIETNLKATNGIIHVIDTVITAPASR
jgi:transforming growth factor-beta-induced protein